MNLKQFSSLKFYFSLFVLAVFFNMNACKKQDAALTPEKVKLDPTVELFFKNAENQSTTIIRVANKIKQLDENSGIIKKLVNNYGLPVWDKCLTSSNNIRVLQHDLMNNLTILL